MKRQRDNELLKFRYSGEYFDEETGTYYLRARYYAPGTGRFMAEDSTMDRLNWYVYFGNNPVQFTDPSGLKRTGSNSRGVWSYQDLNKSQFSAVDSTAVDDSIRIASIGEVS